MRIVSTFASWLTPRRVRAHAVVLLVAMWSVYACDMATPGLLDRNHLVKGPDFLPFYTLGKLALERRGDLLYDMPAQAVLRQEIAPRALPYAYLPFYGPQASLVFAPFAELPYSYALLAWLLLSALIYGICCCAVWRRCPHLQHERANVWLAAAAFPGFFHLITFAQSSALPLLFFTLTYLALRANKQFLAGLAIGCIVFKPQFALAGVIVFLISRYWPLILGAFLSSIAQLAVGCFVYGSAVMKAYIHALLHAGDFPAILEPKLYQSFSLRGFWLLLVPSTAMADILYAASAILVLWMLRTIWKKEGPFDLRYSALLLASLLAAPHANAYDLVILAPAFLMLADFALGHSDHATTDVIKASLYLSFFLFLFLPLTRIIHIQLGVLILILLLWVICESTTSTPEASGLPTAADASVR